jgi:hypothetical protein
MTDSLPDKPVVGGGWHKPEKRGAWREPEKPKEQPGWRVHALPENLETEPEQEGAWHIPQPEDTVFTPEDEIEVVQRPEDALLDIITAEGARVTPVALAAPKREEPLAPEDLRNRIEPEVVRDFAGA